MCALDSARADVLGRRCAAEGGSLESLGLIVLTPLVREFRPGTSGMEFLVLSGWACQIEDGPLTSLSVLFST